MGGNISVFEFLYGGKCVCCAQAPALGGGKQLETKFCTNCFLGTVDSIAWKQKSEKIYYGIVTGVSVFDSSCKNYSDFPKISLRVKFDS